MMRHYIAHHHNTWFDLVAFNTKDCIVEDITSLEDKIKTKFISSLHRPTQYNLNTSDVFLPLQSINYETLSGKTKQILEASIPPEFGVHDPNFFYERSPFYSRAKWGLDHHQTELSGLDILLTYWLSKHLNINYN